MKMRVQLIIIVLFSAICQANAQVAKKLTENQKIEYLIAFIAKQDGVFVRNEAEYSPAQAAEHLRMKWKRDGNTINTAEDFIEKLATSSSISGKAYQIKYKDGRKAQVASLLKAELIRIQKPIQQ